MGIQIAHPFFYVQNKSPDLNNLTPQLPMAISNKINLGQVNRRQHAATIGFEEYLIVTNFLFPLMRNNKQGVISPNMRG